MDPIWFTTEDIVIIYMMGCFTECPECPEPFLPIPLLRLAILDIRTWASPQKTYSIPQYIPPNGSKWQFHHASIIINMEVSWNGGTPKSSIWIGFSITNQPAIGDPLMEPQISPRKKCAFSRESDNFTWTCEKPTDHWENPTGNALQLLICNIWISIYGHIYNIYI